MARSYIRLLPGTFRRKALGILPDGSRREPYPPAAVAAFYGVMELAEEQPVRGRFESRKLLMVLLEGRHGTGRVYARRLGFLIDHGDLIELADGTLYLDGWDELNEGDFTVADRMARYRSRPRSVTPGVTPSVTAPVTVATVDTPSEHMAVGGRHMAVGADGGDTGAPKEPDPLDEVDSWLAARRASVRPDSSTGVALARLVDQHGAKAVIAAMGRLPQPLHDGAQYVYGARKALNPIPDPKAVAASEREAQEKASFDRRAEATKRRIAAYTGAES